MKYGQPFNVKDSSFFNGNDYFLRVPDCIKKNPKLNALDKLVWSQLAWINVQYDGKVHPKQSTLAKELGCTRKGIKKSLTRLRDWGYITWKTPTLAKRNKEATEYSLLWRAEFESEEQCSSDPREQCSSGYGQPREQRSHHYDNYNYELNKTHDNTRQPPQEKIKTISKGKPIQSVCTSSNSHNPYKNKNHRKEQQSHTRRRQ